MSMSRLSVYVRLMRPVNCLMMGFAVVVGATLASANVVGVFWPSIIFGFLTGFLLTAASMAINDYYDREIDAINEPNRPIPSGAIKPSEALGFAFILTLLGFAAAYLTNPTNILVFTTALISWIIVVTYVTVGKRTGLLGNFLVSLCVAIPFIYSSLAVTSTIELNVLIFASMAFLSNTGREITKGIVDVQGDKTQNIKTLAVRFGEKKAAAAAAFFYLSAVFLSPLPWFLDIVSFWFLPLVAITDFGLATSSFILLKDYSREIARKVKKMVLLWFIIGLAAFVVGALT